MLDRVIWAMGIHQNLQFTLIRPFNWIGPGLDSLETPKEGASRVVTQFLGNMLRGEPVTLVDGGAQRRCFTYVDDGLDCLLKIIENDNNCCDGKIFNIGNPKNNYSIRELAEIMRDILGEFSKLLANPERNGSDRRSSESGLSSDAPWKKIEFREIAGKEYYGSDYQDVNYRVPDISNARKILGWEPKISLEQALRLTVSYYIQQDNSSDRLRSLS
jgi:UDP-4-amino-4-deoxy-L-arabinose formyltransferase/UDP-glucuronic acid dehydrogenase (UDP-4-keto-hexauronic acid decarboxylating)